MLIWLLIALMLLATIVALALPVLRARAPDASTADHDLTVFTDQLAELDRDKERGLINDAEFAQARAEVGRRILAARKQQEAGGNASGGATNRNLFAALAILVLIPAIAGPLYLWRGNPQVTGENVMAAAPPGGATPEQTAGLEDSIGRLRARLNANPSDFEGWVLLGRSYMVTQQPQLAIEAYRRAVALRPGDASVQSFLGEAIVFSADGTVTDPAREAFARAVEADGADPAARFYLALAEAQAGNLRAAFDAWLALAQDTPADAPWRPVLMQQLESAAQDIDVDPAAVLPRPSPAPARTQPGPSQADVDAAQDMAPEDRQDMIRGMVARLAARLEENPDDAEGWDRLARSYRVLGETEKAAEAEQRARAARGQTGPTPSASPPVTANPPADADAQREMIAGMVAGLAARLEDDPSDREGWLRLTRSYQVLGDGEKALDAFAKAEAAFPGDPEILQLYARAVIEQSPPDGPLATKAFNLYRRVLEAQGDNPEALYFVGLGESERDNPEEARRLWTRLLDFLQPDSEARRIVEERLKALKTP